MAQEFNPFSVTVTTKLSEEIDAWQKYLLTERRLSDLTGKSYLFDLKEFFDFLKDTELSKELFAIIKKREINKIEEIKDKSCPSEPQTKKLT